MSIRTTSLVGILVLIFLGGTLGWFGNIRYYFDERFGDPGTFFYGSTLGIAYDDYPAYMEEILLDDEPITSVNLSAHKAEANKADANVEVFIYGRFVNSNDNLVVILNDQVIYNSKPRRDMGDLFGEHYLKKHFVVELTGFNSSGENKLIISTGNASETFIIYSS